MVSIVMTVYNGEIHLRNSIESVLKQTYKDFEFIIVNDGSTDSTIDIISEYANKDNRITPINNPHYGIPKSANIGVNKAKGEVIARIDHDDIWFQNKLEYQLGILNKNPNIQLLGSSIIPINRQGDIIKTNNSLFNNNQTINSDLFRKSIMKNCLLCHSTSVFIKQAFNNLGQYNTSFNTSLDYELWSRFASQYDCYIDSKPLAYYRIWENNISTKRKKLQLFNSLRVRVLIFFRLGINFRNIKNFFNFLIFVALRAFLYWLFVKPIKIIFR